MIVRDRVLTRAGTGCWVGDMDEADGRSTENLES